MDPRLAEKVLRGDRKAVSRAISLVENKEEGYVELLSRLTHTRERHS